jgi:hypothetical protein
MRITRFARLLDAFGPDLGRWPPAEAASARALVTESTEAQALLHGAAMLQDALRDSRADADAETLARMRAHVAGRVARMPLPARPGLFDRLRPLVPIGGGAVAALVCCSLWLSLWSPLPDAPGFYAPRQIAMIESDE